MAAPPSLRTWTAGELANAAMLNANVRDPQTFYLRRPMVYVNLSASVSLGSGGYGLLGWGSGGAGIIDTEGTGYNTGGATGIYAVRSGLYDIRGQVMFAANATGVRAVSIDRVTAASVRTAGIIATGMYSSNGAPAGSPTGETTARVSDHGYHLDAGDRLEVYVYQNSGGALNILGATERYTWFCMRWVASS